MTIDKVKQDMLHCIYGLLQEKGFEDNLLEIINDDINIPFINETTELQVFQAIYKAVLAALKRILTRDQLQLPQLKRQ